MSSGSGIGQEAFFNQRATFYDGITVYGDVEGGVLVEIEKDDINIAKNVRTLNFTGNAVSSVILDDTKKSTVRVELASNIDGGKPDSDYGGITALNGGSV